MTYSKYVYVCLLLFLLFVICVFVFAKKKSSSENTKSAPEDTWYFQAEDASGVKTCIHDSGLKPSEGHFSTLTFLKEEINNGEINIIGVPTKIYLGNSFTNLNETVSDFELEEDDLCYYAKFSLK